MLRKMQADILFLDPADVNPGVAELIENDFDVQILDLIDPYGPTVWIRAWAVTELDASAFFDRTQAIIEPLEGWLYEAGLADPPSQFA
jgi:hypothetical protein